MNPQSLRTRKPSYIKSYQQLFLNKVCFPSQNLVISKLNCIKQQDNRCKQQSQQLTQLKLHQFDYSCNPSYFITKLIKICSLENIQGSNELQRKVQQRYSNRQVQRSINQDNLVRVKSNQVRVCQLSNEFQQIETKKVRFYQKVEYWVQNKDQNLEYDYRYFEALKLQ